MLDLLSVGAISAVLGAVGNGMAGEFGRWAWESAGGAVRRVAGREVPAPTTPGQLDDVARLVHERVHTDPQLAHAWALFARSAPVPGVPDRLARPRLPGAPRFFTDREQALKLLDKEATRPFEGRPRLALLHGPEGIGTTTLACHWGWRRTDLYPDGQPYVDLRTRTPEVALGDLLRQLGLGDERIPASADARADLFRRCAADRRMLLVLDHATSAAQLEPLLTTAPGVFTIVVARHALVGLGALRIPVGPLARRDAVRMLKSVAGEDVIAAARTSLPRVLDRCAGSPYALRAAALRLTPGFADPENPAVTPDHPATPVTDPVRAATEDSYRHLAPAAARLYRLAGLRDWPALDAATAARAAGIDETEAARLLGELAEALLLERAGSGRYRYRPSVRAHAERTAAAVDGVAACSAAVARVVDHCRDLAVGAAQAALPESWRVPTAHSPVTFASKGEGVAALTAEAPTLVEAVAAADEFGDPHSVVLLCQALWPLQLKAGRHELLLPALRTGARVADQHFPGTRTAGALHAQLAHSLTELRRWDAAEPEALAAARDERAAGHVRGHASAVEFLGLLRLRQWRFQEAYDSFEQAYGILDGIGPDDEGAADLPRARALLDRHRGRALGRLDRREEALDRLGHALAFFRDREPYNMARTLTDIAEIHLDAGRPGTALPLIDEALVTLEGEQAEYQVELLRVLRERCTVTQ
ncbi:tetratricopeptide repeat protein [Streptomyces cylindrosporus]|uniref:Tetratricopeptide repeat protein n=1 Tax=Streptomyces cylindrosporus TaxID=2927583 RepID=A0ABS9Y190_9ACTN|nr:tetratricopeptide repeat protein [Streptomyces cylindrosporus]MCI3270980.1 tetratricopeptide repeat protein [Streptomyces cylindrosporus]